MERDFDPARLFHLNSSNVRTAIPHVAPPPDRKPSPRRVHPGARRIALAREPELPTPLGAVLTARRSRRDYVPDAILPEPLLGRLLYACAAVTGTAVFDDGLTAGTRTYPSGGGLYPLEIYPVLQRVDGIADGIYHYDPWLHELEEVRAGNVHARFGAMTMGQGTLAAANAILFITAIFERSMWKYGQRGYRYAWIEAGHLGQNLYLGATALGLAPVALGGFYDAEANALLGLEAGEETIYSVCVGVARS